MSKYQTTILQVVIHREDENPVFGESNTYVKVDDEGGGPFLVITQDNTDFHNKEENQIRVDYQELVAIVEAGKMLMHQMTIENSYNDAISNMLKE